MVEVDVVVEIVVEIVVVVVVILEFIIEVVVEVVDVDVYARCRCKCMLCKKAEIVLGGASLVSSWPNQFPSSQERNPGE